MTICAVLEENRRNFFTEGGRWRIGGEGYGKESQNNDCINNDCARDLP
jgi:hypothetical protein